MWQLWTLKSNKVLMETPYTIVTPYLVLLGSLFSITEITKYSYFSLI